MSVLWVTVCVLFLGLTQALEFYPNGPAFDSKLPQRNDVSSLEIPLTVPIRFFGETYSSIYVNSNGLLSFLTEIPMFFSIQFPLNYPVIAPLYANVDTSGRGQVFYRETQDPELLRRFNERVARFYPNLASPFSARNLFIASWLEVGYFPRGEDKVNTFQAVVGSDGTESFVELLYRQGGIQWVQGRTEGTRLPDARAQAGFVAEDGRLYTLRGSGTDQIQNLDRWTNTDEPGAWLFRVGDTGDTGNVEPPQAGLSFGDSENLVEDASCQTGATFCHSRARCEDVDEGFCCLCQQGFYGNGRTCLPDQIPLRVNGKLKMSLNSAPEQEVDVQAYVVTTDGRAYTALSRVPPAFGTDAQLITSTADIIGWLFAKSISDAENGYKMTGGVLNHTATLTFASSQHRVTVEQSFLGLDVFDQLRLEGSISGTLPQVPHGYKLTLPDIQIQFRKVSKGVVRSQNTYVVYVEGSIEQFPVTVEQTISYNEYCPSSSTESTLRLKAARNFISYEETENILRFASTNKISSLSENDDPCVIGQVSCVNNSHCIPEGSTFRCVCKNGFQTLYSDEGSGDYGCVDINECQSGSHRCDQNALCINEVGSFSCQCRPGFIGDGYSCQAVPQAPQDCSSIRCTPGAECVDSAETGPHCRCIPGFIGDGTTCTPNAEAVPQAPQDCSSIRCTPGAECVDSAETGPHCRCIPGFIGDGTTCTPNAEDDCLMCSPHAYCNRTQYGNVQCTCLSGYYGNGRDCALVQDTVPRKCLLAVCWCPSEYEAQGDVCVRRHHHTAATQPPHTAPADRDNVSCNAMNNCHPQAQCIYLSTKGAYECQCNAGFEGDGYDCSEMELSCKEADICHGYATCVDVEDSDRGICMCDDGYQGDGMTCYKIDMCSEDLECGEHAACIWSDETFRKECECDQGYVLDYKICIKQGCDECHKDAECVNSPTGTPQCVCRSGLVGDGVEICEPEQTSCKVLDNCAREAECVFISAESGYRCQCQQGYEGSGLECHQISNCLDDPSLCDSNARCVPSTGGYECQCNSGYFGNGQICKEVRQREGNFLLVNKGMATVKMPLEPSKSNPGRPIQLQYDQTAVGLAVDCVEGLLYWSDITDHVIKSSSFSGKDVKEFVDEEISSPEGLAVDWIGRKLYWTDSGKDVIKAADLNTGEVEVIISSGLKDPRGIAVHPTRRKIFWSDWNRAAPKIESANLDGSARSLLVSRDVTLPNSLAVDWTTQEICWTDAGTKRIECLGIDSGVRRTVVSNCTYPFGLTITEDKYYWTDWSSQKVESAYKFGATKSDSLTVPFGGSGKLYGIAAVSDNCPRV